MPLAKENRPLAGSFRAFAARAVLASHGKSNNRHKALRLHESAQARKTEYPQTYPQPGATPAIAATSAARFARPVSCLTAGRAVSRRQSDNRRDVLLESHKPRLSTRARGILPVFRPALVRLANLKHQANHLVTGQCPSCPAGPRSARLPVPPVRHRAPHNGQRSPSASTWACTVPRTGRSNRCPSSGAAPSAGE